MSVPATPPSPAPAPPPAPDDADDWQRLHPLSPLLRGGLVVLAVLGYLASQLVERVLGSVGLDQAFPGPDVGVGDVGDVGDPTTTVTAHPLLALLVIVLVIAAIAGGNYVSWRFSRFRVGARQVELRQGVLFRQHRQVPFERVQAVELSRPILARLLGLAQVVVQSAGGSDSNLTLSFLALSRAEGVRDELLVLAGRSDETEVHQGPDESAEPAVGRQGPPAVTPVLAVPNGRLFLATILHGPTLVLLALGAATLLGVGVARWGSVAFAGIPALVPVLFGVGVGRVRELLTNGNFHLADAASGLRIQHGLTDLRTTTIPLHRIQALELVQPLWWRLFGWWRIRVNVAGIASGGEGDGERETTLLPVGTLEEALHVLGILGHEQGVEVLRDAAVGGEAGAGWVRASARARFLDPISWRHNAWTLTPSAVVLRSGRLTRRAVTVPRARVQSLAVSQGPLDARLGVASVTVVSTPGPVSASLAHLDVAVAEAFLDQVAAAARVARRAATTNPPAPHLAPGPPGLVD